MKVTLVPTDNVVVIDGRAATVDLSDLLGDDDGGYWRIRAVQWDGTVGVVERVIGEPFRIADLSDYQAYVDQALAVFEAEDNPPAPDLLSVAADKRWRVEQGGTTWNGWVLQTDDRSQSKYQAELMAVNEGVRVDGSYWKFPHGFEPLQNAQIRAMAIAARQHVLSSFEREAQILQLIGAGTITTADEIENWSEWGSEP